MLVRKANMKSLNVTFTDEEYEELKSEKVNKMSWHSHLIQLTQIYKMYSEGKLVRKSVSESKENQPGMEDEPEDTHQD